MLGWSDAQMYEMYWHTWIEFEHENVIIDDEDETQAGLECTIIHMPLEPFPGYLDY
jgi:hypothetical protein